MPRIHEIMQKRSGYTHFTKMDLSMQFYCFELDEESKKYTTIITPDGQLYEYNRLPMGMKISPDEAQSIMEKILEGLNVTCYIDDLRIWTNGSFDEHLELVDKVLQRLADSNLKTNPVKCNWGVRETDFLGYEMTPDSCKPMKQKIEALLKMSAPSNKKQVRSFLGAINFYKSM